MIIAYIYLDVQFNVPQMPIIGKLIKSILATTSFQIFFT